MRRQILIGVWQNRLTPKQARRELVRAGPELNKEKKKRVLEILSALKKREIRTVNEAEQELREEGLGYEDPKKKRGTEEYLCQI